MPHQHAEQEWDPTELKVFGNSGDAIMTRQPGPRPKLVLHWRTGRIIAPRRLDRTPEWAKPIVAQAIKSSQDQAR